MLNIGTAPAGDLLRPPPLRQLIESARVAALRSYGVLGNGSPGRFDALCQAAATALDAPVACVSFLDADREWVHGRFGADMPDVPRHLSFCHHTIHEPGGLLAVADLLEDARFSAYPCVQSGPAHRSYAAASIVDPGDYRIGAVAVLDRRRRQFGHDALQALQRLAVAVMDNLLPPRGLELAGEVAPAAPTPPSALVQGWLGVRTERALTSLSAPRGLRLVSVAQGGPAARAGLQPGDVLFAVSDQETREAGDITRALAARALGEPVPVHIWRSGEAMQRVVYVEAMPESQRTRRRSAAP